MGGEITTAHVAVMVATLGVVVPIFTALGLFLLNRLFGGGDDLQKKVHALELAQLKADTATRDHVANHYATQDDIRRLERQIDGLGTRISEYTATVAKILGPLAKRLNLDAADSL